VLIRTLLNMWFFARYMFAGRAYYCSPLWTRHWHVYRATTYRRPIMSLWPRNAATRHLLPVWHDAACYHFAHDLISAVAARCVCMTLWTPRLSTHNSYMTRLLFVTRTSATSAPRSVISTPPNSMRVWLPADIRWYA